MSKPNKYPTNTPQRSSSGPSAAPVESSSSIVDALGPEVPEVDVDLAPLGLTEDEPETPPADPLDDVRGPDAPPPEEAVVVAPLRSFMALNDCTFSMHGHGLAVKAGKVYGEERYGAKAMDLMSKSSKFAPVATT